jgi:hypothetical protein
MSIIDTNTCLVGLAGFSSPLLAVFPGFISTAVWEGATGGPRRRG